MTVQEFLNQGRILYKKIESLKVQLRYLHELADSTNSRPFDEPVVHKQRSGKAKFEFYIDKIFAKEDELNNKINELLEIQNKIEELISQLDDPIEILILRERYINCFTWEEIETRTDYSRSYIFKMHQSALSKIKLVD